MDRERLRAWSRPIDRTGSGGGPVELVHQPPTGLAGCGEFLVAFFQRSAEAQDGLALGFELGSDGCSAGRGAEAAAFEGLLAE
jgi:hypothetical protein